VIQVQWKTRTGRARSLLISALLAVLACGNKQEEASSPQRDQAERAPALPPAVVMSAPRCPMPLTTACHFTALEYFRVEMCRCSDKLCVDAVRDKYKDWSLEFQTGGPSEEPSAEMYRKMVDSIRTYTDCMSKVLLAPAAGSAN
jgi:hypothetical protein